MQYTANKPYNSVLIIQPSGLRYRLQEDHIFKEIRYTQLTGIKIKKDYARLYFGYFLAPLIIFGQFFIIQEQGLNWVNGLNLLVWFVFFGMHFLFKLTFTIAVQKGPLTAEVFMTHNYKMVKQIKKEIESHL